MMRFLDPFLSDMGPIRVENLASMEEKRAKSYHGEFESLAGLERR